MSPAKNDIPNPFSKAPLEMAAPRVLVADDSTDILNLLGFMLRAEGWDVSTAETAEATVVEALAFQPQVILLDYQFPDGDGFSLAEQLQSNPATSAIPRVLFTAMPERGLPEDAEGLFSAQLSKKANPDTISEQLRALLPREH